MPTDFERLDAWREGDRAAGSELFGRHFEALFRFFRNKVAGSADDLIQRTMLGCVEHRDRFNKQSTYRTYLFAIARHELLDHLRRRHRAGEEINFTSVSLHDLGTSPSSAVARDERSQKLEQALAMLPVDFQIALELSYSERMGGPEIAEVLGINANTVRSRLARGRQMLRRELSRLGVDTRDFAG